VTNIAYGSAGGMISLTPGIRFNVAPHSRVSLYVAAGVGPAVFGEDTAVAGAGFVRRDTSWTVGAAFDFGGGLDFRLTRLVSLRVEACDFVTGRGLGGVEGRNHPIFSFGLGIHW
jgi:opacity protein-like surface antigen